MAGLREDHLGVISSLQCGSAVPTQHSPCPTAREGLGMGPFRVKIMEEVFTKPGGTVGGGCVRQDVLQCHKVSDNGRAAESQM